MKPFFPLIFLFGCLLFTLTAVKGQANKFGQPVHFNDIHTVYTYQKSNWDGSHSSIIYLYIRDTGRLESFKWTQGDANATLVSADIDWNQYRVDKLRNQQVTANGNRTNFAELETIGLRKIRFRVGDFRDSMLLDADLWQSYDFDFAGLGYCWRALRDKFSSFSFLVADAGMNNDKMAFENKGQVQVEYLGTEQLNGKKCLKYKIDGPGLQHKGGHIWISPDHYMIEQYRIALPDEPGFENGQLKLLNTEKLSPTEWEKFIIAKMTRE